MANLVDLHVGRRIRGRRWLLGLTQADLAEIAGVRFQQIQKYETGKDRVSASRLWQIAEGLETNVTFFFEGLGMENTPPAPPDILMNVLRNWGNLAGFGKAPIPCQQARPFCNE